MDTATVSVLVSGGVGLAGLATPIVIARMNDKRQRQSAQDARWDELRTVVDDAAVALLAVLVAAPQIEEVRDGFDHVRDSLPRLRSALNVVWQQEARLAARLGIESEIVVRYRDAHNVLGAIFTYWSAVTDGETPPQGLREPTDGLQPALSAFFHVAARAIGPDRET